MTKSEQQIQNEIRATLAPYGITHRYNVGDSLSFDGRYLKSSLPKGHSDLIFFSKTGRAVFIECKTAKGKLSKEQENFLNIKSAMGFQIIVGRSAEQVLNEIKEWDSVI